MATSWRSWVSPMPGYWIARGTIDDQTAYAEYARRWEPIGERYHARFLAAGGRHETREGPQHARISVIEFPSYEQALACYHDPDYQACLPYALNAYANRRDLVIVEG